MQPTTAQSPTVPFALGDTISFRYDENRGAGQKCKATAIVGDYVRCQGDDSKWWNLRAIRLIDVSK